MNTTLTEGFFQLDNFGDETVISSPTPELRSDLRAALISAMTEAAEIESDNLRNPRSHNMERVIAAKVRQLAIEQLIDCMDGADILGMDGAAQ